MRSPISSSDIDDQGKLLEAVTNPDMTVEGREKALGELPRFTKNMIAKTMVEKGVMQEGFTGKDLTINTIDDWQHIPADEFAGELDAKGGQFQKPSDEDTKMFADNTKLVVGGILLCVLFAPILCLIVMTFFCCQLKSLSDHSETKREACLGTILGCGIFPVIFILATLFSIFSMIFMIPCARSSQTLGKCWSSRVR